MHHCSLHRCHQQLQVDGWRQLQAVLRLRSVQAQCHSAQALAVSSWEVVHQRLRPQTAHAPRAARRSKVVKSQRFLQWRLVQQILD